MKNKSKFSSRNSCKKKIPELWKWSNHRKIQLGWKKNLIREIFKTKTNKNILKSYKPWVNLKSNRISRLFKLNKTLNWPNLCNEPNKSKPKNKQFKQTSPKSKSKVYFKQQEIGTKLMSLEPSRQKRLNKKSQK